MPLLQGKEDKSSPAPHEFMFHYCGDVIHSARYTPTQGIQRWSRVVFRVSLASKLDCIFYAALNYI